MNRQKRLAIFDKLSQAIPNPKTELNYSSHFELLIAVILSAQSTDKGVNKATDKLFTIANTPEQIYNLGTDKLKKYIKTIGLYNTKATNIIKTCAMLIKLHNCTIPQTRQQLEALPGVGRKTANVILNTAFGQPTIAVDTHIFRVSNRTKIATGKNVLQVEQQLLKYIPKKYLIPAHHLLILHGRYTCTARKPKCGVCIIYNLCEYQEKTA
jgi:endonuclease-3